MTSLLSPHSALAQKLQSALDSREIRSIRRRLPDPVPASALSSPLTDFTSNDYLSLSSSNHLRSCFLTKLSSAPDILGSGGSRLLVNGQAHANLEERLKNFFDVEAALLFNSGYHANVGFFTSIPQPGDVIVYDEYIHASVLDGMRASRVNPLSLISFKHNSLTSFRLALMEAYNKVHSSEGQHSIFVAVESLYSMDGTFAPLKEMVEVIEEEIVLGGENAYLIVDEAHSTGIYGPNGKGRVAMLGLEHKVFARLHTFGKALAASGAVILTNNLVKDYLINYARSLIYTTSLSYATIISADASFDMLIDGTASQLANRLLSLSKYFTSTFTSTLRNSDIPPSLISLCPHSCLPSSSSDNLTSASPIIPILTPHPRPLSSYLHKNGMNAKPITWPTVPKGKDRVRICLHAGITKEDVDKLIRCVVEWAGDVLMNKDKEMNKKRNGGGWREGGVGVGGAERVFAKGKL
ncbi:hypothetical protein AGABI1DRAFT_76236 [Agaricus bisporus var. burnettii JB137-S8]|uniref:Aminotransferase class I/classII large domain-containing protein n=1 Tax=Agaricus bisporus var. burnettii (strain JB137-S8 / ATCC MYA-4627 / FGSC 10392) TaxID=597362 RepID=K5XSH2_AGABU|nr:uncharacterized protein AGABI1DRAFT_76236 [Agaricus bisporus var. burnettii JB137-S8]EKM77900.1 hypothetical protein AGABI1DRAFT_76236 [Agaricus bisporus var. burnettii JB137-S8]